ncbi:hypothetical protein Moror_3745 [Moniliophthora roreri MCA 2997]|uniref:Uncharacterized protein n=1 Tax=Moniliophthora roreri (strain MCA 2997) TaxID=1381753 RepID=V2XY05_MONRO|nr:hypothetical protein Moror_3745 [Moniliophthora roreri MCA 2997]
MSNASSTSSTSSYFTYGLPNTPSGTDRRYSNNITYTEPFNPSPFELLFLVNTAGHDNALRNASLGQPHLQFAVDGLIHLWAQCASLNAIIEETNVYVANLAFNATASKPSFPINSERLECELHTQLYRLGPLPTDICNTNPNDPAFIRAAEIPSRDSSPTYAQSIGVATASPSPAPKPQSEAALPPSVFDPFNVDDEQLAPPSVPFLANGQFNPAFVSLQDAVQANPNIQIDTRTFTNPPAPYNYLTNTSFSMGRQECLRNCRTG